MVRKNILLLFFLLVFAGNIFAQDFGFGFDDNAEDGAGLGAAAASGSRSDLSIKMGGEIAVEMTPYVHDFKKKDNGGQAISFWDMASSALNFTLSASNVSAYAAFNLNSGAISELWTQSPELSKASHTPLIINEAFLRAFIGPVNIEAGFRKLAWGKADSLGPLDVTNPLDYSDLRNISDINAIKIARPMLHLTWNTGDFSKLEAVFIPNFAGHRFAQEGRWRPAQYSTISKHFLNEIVERASLRASLNPMLSSFIPFLKNTDPEGFSFPFPDTSTLDYFQTGLRFTTTIGPVDIGGQYYYGNLFNPAVSLTTNGIDTFLDDLISQIPQYPNIVPHSELLDPQIKYNRYHQIGIDYAQVVFGFNLRAEFAAHITEDLAGDDGSVRNPFLGWSFGFDRDVVWGITANVQINETIRLLNDKVGKNPAMDSEAGTDATATRLTMQLSKKFMRDSLESKVSIIWDMENSGCYIIPAVVWTMGGLNAELSAGIFAGKDTGELGQYWENSFIRAGLKYTF